MVSARILVPIAAVLVKTHALALPGIYTLTYNPFLSKPAVAKTSPNNEQYTPLIPATAPATLSAPTFVASAALTYGASPSSSVPYPNASSVVSHTKSYYSSFTTKPSSTHQTLKSTTLKVSASTSKTTVNLFAMPTVAAPAKPPRKITLQMWMKPNFAGDYLMEEELEGTCNNREYHYDLVTSAKTLESKSGCSFYEDHDCSGKLHAPGNAFNRKGGVVDFGSVLAKKIQSVKCWYEI